MIGQGEPALFDVVEESVIRTAFAWCNQNQVQTAKTLGISRNILRTHLKRFGLIGCDAGAAAELDDAGPALVMHAAFG